MDESGWGVKFLSSFDSSNRIRFFAEYLFEINELN